MGKRVNVATVAVLSMAVKRSAFFRRCVVFVVFCATLGNMALLMPRGRNIMILPKTETEV